MKRLIVLLLIFIAISCSSEEEKRINLNNFEAFAFQLDSGWELNASAIVKDFTSEKTSDKFNSKISYHLDLIEPDSSIVKEADYGLIDLSENEELNEYQLNIQIELDSAFSAGDYKMILIVNDDLSGKNDTITAGFNLSLD